MAYFALFTSAFLSATLLPLNSELVFAALLKKEFALLGLWFIATTGNTLGSAVNWYLGRFLLKYQERRWFPFKQKSLARAEAWFSRFGKWSLILAWLPVVGDALTFIAGTLRVKFSFFILLTALGKGLRYAVVAVIVLNLI